MNPVLPSYSDYHNRNKTVRSGKDDTHRNTQTSKKLSDLKLIVSDGHKLKAVNQFITSIGTVPQILREKISVLYLSQNNLRHLNGIQQFVNLKILSLGSNLIDDFDELQLLKDIVPLTSLNLLGNPVCKFPYYRYHVVNAIPQLELIDNIEVSMAEKNQANLAVLQDIHSRQLLFSNHCRILQLKLITLIIQMHKELFTVFFSKQYTKIDILLLLKFWDFKRKFSEDESFRMMKKLVLVVHTAYSQMKNASTNKAISILHKVAVAKGISKASAQKEMKASFTLWDDAFSSVIALQQTTISKLNGLCESYCSSKVSYSSLSKLKMTTLKKKTLIKRPKICRKDSILQVLPPQQSDPDSSSIEVKKKSIYPTNKLDELRCGDFSTNMTLHEAVQNFKFRDLETYNLLENKSGKKSVDGGKEGNLNLSKNNISTNIYSSSNKFGCDKVDSRFNVDMAHENINVLQYDKLSNLEKENSFLVAKTEKLLKEIEFYKSLQTCSNDISSRISRSFFKNEEDYIVSLTEAEHREKRLKDELSCIQKQVLKEQEKNIFFCSNFDINSFEVALLRKASLFWSKNSLRRTFIKFRKSIAICQGLKRFDYRHLLKFFNKWKLHRTVYLRHNKIRAISLFNLKKDKFIKWSDYTRLQIIHRFAIKRRARESLKYTWRKLLFWSNCEKIVKQRRSEASAKEIKQFIYRTFNLWKSVVNYTSGIKRLFLGGKVVLRSYFAREKWVRLAFLQWKTWIIFCQRPVQRNISKYKKNCLINKKKAIWKKWTVYQDAVRQCNCNLKKNAWKYWCLHITAVLKKKSSRKQASYSLKKNLFIRWQQFSRSRMHFKVLGNKADKFHIRFCLRKIWRILSHFKLFHRRRRFNSLKAFRFYFKKLLQAAWDSWSQFIVVKKSLDHSVNQSAFMETFKSRIASSERRRHLNHLMKVVSLIVRRRQTYFSSTCFKKWKTCVIMRKMLRKRLLFFWRIQRQRDLLFAFSSWFKTTFYKCGNKVRTLEKQYESKCKEHEEISSKLVELIKTHQENGDKMRTRKHQLQNTIAENIKLLRRMDILVKNKHDSNRCLSQKDDIIRELKCQVEVLENRIIKHKYSNTDEHKLGKESAAKSKSLLEKLEDKNIALLDELKVERNRVLSLSSDINLIKEQKAEEIHIATTVANDYSKKIQELEAELNAAKTEHQELLERDKKYEKKIRDTCKIINNMEEVKMKEIRELRENQATIETKLIKETAKTNELIKMSKEKNQEIAKLKYELKLCDDREKKRVASLMCEVKENLPQSHRVKGNGMNESEEFDLSGFLESKKLKQEHYFRKQGNTDEQSMSTEELYKETGHINRDIKNLQEKLLEHVIKEVKSPICPRRLTAKKKKKKKVLVKKASRK